MLLKRRPELRKRWGKRAGSPPHTVLKSESKLWLSRKGEKDREEPRSKQRIEKKITRKKGGESRRRDKYQQGKIKGRADVASSIERSGKSTQRKNKLRSSEGGQSDDANRKDHVWDRQSKLKREKPAKANRGQVHKLIGTGGEKKR